jgi:hypothetical protein
LIAGFGWRITPVAVVRPLWCGYARRRLLPGIDCRPERNELHKVHDMDLPGG